MRKSVGALLGLSAAVALLAVACTESPTAPTRPVVQSAQSKPANLLGLTLPVNRTTPLASDVSWTFTATPWGATSSNASVGLTVVIPFGALSSTQTITVTAVKGSAVAYRFEPHITFSKNVTLKQNLAGTDANLLSGLLLEAGHFPGDTVEFSGLLALVDETVPVSLLSFLLSNQAVWQVGHFSGWLLANERADDGGF